MRIISQLPENSALSGLCGGLIDAWKLQNKPEAAILFVIEEVSYNICDQVSRIFSKKHFILLVLTSH